MRRPLCLRPQGALVCSMPLSAHAPWGQKHCTAFLAKLAHDPPPPAPHQPAAAPSPQPTSKQQRQQWQVEGPQEGAAPSTGNSPYGVRKWAEDLEEADDIVLLSAGSAEDSTSFKVCEQEGAEGTGGKWSKKGRGGVSFKVGEQAGRSEEVGWGEAWAAA
eukprot:1158199-Pelagomonas_calceolata.AAC.4